MHGMEESAERAKRGTRLGHGWSAVGVGAILLFDRGFSHQLGFEENQTSYNDYFIVRLKLRIGPPMTKPRPPKTEEELM